MFDQPKDLPSGNPPLPQRGMAVFSPSLYFKDDCNGASELSSTDPLVQRDAHRVYNFEVAEHHTYIADGIRVHNKSVLSFLHPHELAGDLEVIEWDEDGPTHVQVAYYDENGNLRSNVSYKTETIDGKLVAVGHSTFVDEELEGLYQVQFVRDEERNVISSFKPYRLTGADFGEDFGELITPYLATALIGEDGSIAERILAETVLGTTVENVFEFAGGTLHSFFVNLGEKDGHGGVDTDVIAQYSFRDIGEDLLTNFGGSVSEALSNAIMAEVFGGLAGDSFGEEVVVGIVDKGLDFIVDTGLHALATELFGEQDWIDKAFETGLGSGTQFADVLGVSSIAVLGIEIGLSRLLPDIKTVEGLIAKGGTKLALNIVADKILPAVNVDVLGFFGISGPIASFNPVVFLISHTIGQIFDSLFVENPEAFTNVLFDEESGTFSVGTSWSHDDGNLQTGQTLATNYVDFMNGLLTRIQGTSNNLSEVAESIELTFGHFEESIRNGSQRNFHTLEEAFKSRVIDTLQHAEFADGDLLAIAAIRDVVLEADFLDSITHFGLYYYTTGFIFKKDVVAHYTEINGELVAGISNEELIEFSQEFEVDGHIDLRSHVLSEVNSVYSDLQISSFSDTDGLLAILDRVTSSSAFFNLNFTYEIQEDPGVFQSFPDHPRALKVLGDAIFIRGLVIRLESEGYPVATMADMMAALNASELEIVGDNEAFDKLSMNLHTASEYSEYLNNQAAYDAAMNAYGPESAYTQGWAATFLEAGRLGMKQDFIVVGDEGDNVFLASSGDDNIEGLQGDDQIRSYSGADILKGGTGEDTLFGGRGDDALFGGEGNDTLVGGSGVDEVVGGAGDDVLDGGAGADELRGGGGLDTVSYASSLTGIQLDLANTSLNTGDALGDVYSAIEKFQGSSFADVILGNAGDNTLHGGDGDDQIDGRLGDDSLFGGAGNDHLTDSSGGTVFDGGDGIDVVSYSWMTSAILLDMRTGSTLHADTFISIEGIEGTDVGSDTLIGNGADNILIGRSGADILRGQGGDDLLMDWSGGNELRGGSGIDTVSYKGSATDVVVDLSDGSNSLADTLIEIENLTGSIAGNDDLFGDIGENVLSGLAGDDHLKGRAGDDVLIGGAGADILSGGSHTDTASYETSIEGVRAYLLEAEKNTGDAKGDSYFSIENLTGSDRNDVFYANNESNTVSGGFGADRLYGRRGDDHLFGEEGDDIIHGDGGHDNIFGGNGDDTLYGDTSTYIRRNLSDEELASLNWSQKEKFIGDVNDDGRDDFIGMTGDGQGKISVWLASETGGFEVAIQTDSGVGNAWWSSREKHVGDFNGDGNADIVGFNGKDDATAAALVWSGNDDGGFEFSKRTFDDFANSWWSDKEKFVGDANGDGYDDIIALTGGAADLDHIKVWFGSEEGSFSLGAQTTGGVASAIGSSWWANKEKFIGDVNGDGKADIISLTGNSASSINVWFGSDSGEFYLGSQTNSELAGADWSARSKYAADINGDGRTDLVSLSDDATKEIISWIADENGQFVRGDTSENKLASAWWSNRERFIGDINGDGLDELISLSGNSAEAVKIQTIDVGNDLIDGGEGNDFIAGQSGSNILIGGKGNDTIKGGMSEDIFVFSAEDGYDDVINFQQGSDRIAFVGTEITYDSLKLVQVETDVHIEYSVSDVIVVKDASLVDFESSDFVFGYV